MRTPSIYNPEELLWKLAAMEREDPTIKQCPICRADMRRFDNDTIRCRNCGHNEDPPKGDTR